MDRWFEFDTDKEKVLIQLGAIDIITLKDDAMAVQMRSGVIHTFESGGKKAYATLYAVVVDGK